MLHAQRCTISPKRREGGISCDGGGGGGNFGMLMLELIKVMFITLLLIDIHISPGHLFILGNVYRGILKFEGGVEMRRGVYLIDDST